MSLTSLRKSLNLSQLALALLLVAGLWLFYGGSVYQLFAVQTAGDNESRPIGLSAVYQVLNDPYIRHVIGFSFFQAFLSAVLSIGLGLLTAHALFYREFIGKQWLIKLFSLSMVLPVLVAIFGLLGVYGKSGWLADITVYLGLDWQPNIYGLTGILLAHVFFNLPLSAKVFLTALHAIPHQQRKLANQLGVIDSQFVKLVELPYLRQALPSLFVLVFMLCFTSFTVVLTMGGSPKYTTLEVAIYQAVMFDFELQLGAIIALLQFGFCFALFALSSYFSSNTATTVNAESDYITPLSRPWQWLHRAMIGVCIAFVCLPLLAVLTRALDWQAWMTSLHNPQLYKALGFSLTIALCAGLVSVAMAVILLLGARQLHWQGFTRFANNLVSMGMMVLAIPTLVLAVGLFLWLRSLDVGTLELFVIVVLCNALMGMPFALRMMAEPFYNNMSYYERLCQSLGVRGLARMRLIEWQALKKPITSALALTTALSLGDFTAIALFGNQDFTSLPHLLYQQLGSYRSNEGSVTAFILLMLCAGIFMLVERE